MPLFGGKRQEENEKLRAEVDRLSALAIPQLAAEVNAIAPLLERQYPHGATAEGA